MLNNTETTMTTMNNSGKGDIRFRANIKPFTHIGRGNYRVLVQEDGAVLVWDDRAEHYTRVHSLSERSMARLRREAAKIAKDMGTGSHFTRGFSASSR